METALVITAAVFAFVVFWVVLVKAIGHFGGWGRLAQHYAAREDFDGRKWRFESGRFGRSARYGGCLTFGANARGLHLSTFLPFSPGHPALFIPWGDVTLKKTTFWGFPNAELCFRREPGVSLQVREKLGKQMAEVAGLPWPPGETEPG